MNSSGQPYKIVIAGSPALGSEIDGWAAIVQKELEKIFGETISVVVKIHDLTSQEYITQGKHEELAREQADLLLLEQFILKNNGKVGNDLAAENYSEILVAIKEANLEAVVILQPANPLSLAKYYPLQVEALLEYAEGIIFPTLTTGMHGQILKMSGKSFWTSETPATQIDGA